MAPVASFVSTLSVPTMLTFKAAFYCLISESQYPTFRALDLFLKSNLNCLKKCYDPFGKRSKESLMAINKNKISIDEREYEISEASRSEAVKLSSILDLDEIHALRIVFRFQAIRISNSTKMIEYILHYFSERRYLIQLVCALFQYKTYPMFAKNEIARKYAIEIQVDSDYLMKTVRALKANCLNSVEIDGDESLSLIFARQRLLEEELLLELIWSSVTCGVPVTSQFAKEWFSLLEDTIFFQENYPLMLDMKSSILDVIQARAVSISLLLFDLEELVDLNAGEKDNLRTPHNIALAHSVVKDILLEIPSASPICFAWAIVLHRILIASTYETSEIYSDTLLQLFGHNNSTNPSAEIADKAASYDVFNVALKMFKLLPNQLAYAEVFALFLRSSLPYITNWDRVSETFVAVQSSYPLLGELFLKDDAAIIYFKLLKLKFPLQITPVLRILQSLGPPAYDILLHMEHFMQLLPRGYRDYDVSSEDASKIISLSEICLYAPREDDNEGGMFLEVGACGETVSNGPDGFVVIWSYAFDGWAYVGRVLEHAATVSPTAQTVGDIISLLTSTLGQLDTKNAAELLSHCSQALRDYDIVKVIGEILEDSMQSQDVEISVAAINFFSVLVPIQPHRVWKLLKSSNLLNKADHGGLASFILSSVEIISGDYRFTIAIIKMVSTMVKDAVIGKFSKMVTSDIKIDVLLQLIRHLTGVFESFPYWKYEDLAQRLEIATSLSDLFTDVILTVYGIDENSEGLNKINNVLFPASQHILDKFLTSEGKNVRCLQPLLGAIEAAGRNLDALTAGPLLVNKNYDWVESALRFSETLAKVRSSLNRKPSLLERKLFTLSPALVKLFVREDILHTRIMSLFTTLVSSVWNDEPPSLLAHVGTSTALTFISALAYTIQSELEDTDAQEEVAKFLSAVFSHKQQGLAILLLTGKELGSESNEQSVSLVECMENKAKLFEKLPSEFAVRILESIALAQNSWATTIFDSKKNEDFLKMVFVMVERGSLPISGAEQEDVIIQRCYGSLLAARAVQLCAVQLHKGRASQKESREIVKYFLQNDTLLNLASVALRIQGYRGSLHGHLHKNFDSKWPTARLIRFQQSSLLPRKYGISYKFDLNMMEDIFSADPIWSGYRKEIIQANLNLSLIDAQSHLFQSWWLLVTALLDYTDSEPDLLKPLESIAILCLQINIETGIPATIFYPITNNRSSLAFAIVQKLYTAALGSKHEFDFKKIFTLAYYLIMSIDVDFERSLTEGNHPVYRPLLRILLICVKAMRGTKVDKDTAEVVNGTLEGVVSQTFRILGPDALDAFKPPEKLKNNILSDAAEDLLLVTSLLRDCLNLDGVLYDK
ncbi:nucleoporin subcomplex protein binding to Pom34-domain-containing protein [Dipodascopsis uninucleata]